MSTLILMLVTGLGLGGLYFLLASGLALIFGLMGVLNFAHGAVVTLSGFLAWMVMSSTPAPDGWTFLLAVVTAMATGLVASVLLQVVVLRRLFGRPLEQLLATVGVGIALVALMSGIWGSDEHLVPLPGWLKEVTVLAGANIPNSRIVLVAAAVLVLIFVLVFLKVTRHGLIIRAAVEKREMVQAMGIDVTRSFTLVFAIAGAIAGLGGALATVFYRAVVPDLGDGVLIFAFIVLIVGGIGSIVGAAIAAVGLGLIQALANYYIGPGIGDVLVVVALAVTLLVRPAGLMGAKERLA